MGLMVDADDQVLGQPDVKEKGEQVLRGEEGISPRRGSQSNK